MIEEYCGWTREVDWGNAPSWAAVLVAFSVGVFTIVNVITARRAYKDSVWQTKIKQARTVFAHIVLIKHLATSDPVAARHYASRTMGTSQNITQYAITPSEISGNNDGNCAILVEIVNNGDEPVRLNALKFEALCEPTYDMDFSRAIPPKSTYRVVFIVPGKIQEGRALNTLISFRDSAGIAWLRSDVGTPYEDKDFDSELHWEAEVHYA